MYIYTPGTIGLQKLKIIDMRVFQVRKPHIKQNAHAPPPAKSKTPDRVFYTTHPFRTPLPASPR